MDLGSARDDGLRIPPCESRRLRHRRAHGREGRVADAQTLRGRSWRPRLRNARFETNLRQAVPCCRWRFGTDSIAVAPRIGPDDRAVSWYETGSRSRT